MDFKIGDSVTWTSSAQGSTKTKTGKVVQVVPAARNIAREHHAFGLMGYGLPRDHTSYVVHVPGKTEKSKGTRYWPRAAALKAVQG